MNISGIMETMGLIATFAGIPGTVWFNYTAIKNRKEISWKKIMKKGIVKLAEEVEKIAPDYIITFSGRGAIVCSLVVTELDNKYPVYMCLLKRRYNNSFLDPQNWTSFDTSKWTVFVPDEVLKLKNKKILIIDDLTNSGETIEKLTKHLINCGFRNQNLFSMALVANIDVLSRLHIPQEYWKKVEISEYNVPWGKTEIK